MRTHLHTAILTIVLCSAQVREDEDTRPISPAEAMTMDTLTTTDINSSYVKHTTEHEAAVVTSVGDDVVTTTQTTKTTTSRPRRKLWVTYTTPNSDAGYVTTPFYGESAPYLNHINDSFILDLPPNHVVMISFSDFDIADHNNCRNDSVTLYEIVQRNTSQVWKKCGPYTLGLPAQVFRNSLRLDVQSNLTRFNAGFKMLFTVLPESQEPESLGNGTYNCSVPHFERFRPHFNCNLVKECQDMEDERDCSYTSDECGVGFVDLGDKCFTFPRKL
ncbi:hypothetical protein BaRGS_00034285 [Batillaria attramentaria]|uniref:CUB domain-containing protein n=1 Tax=Batillaria attramentaria TaxID=370345 RepID=A0ABD0JI52_9CAEN